MTVALVEITAKTVRRITSLAVRDEQQGFVAPNAVSLAEALFAPEAWYRAIHDGDEPVGFVMLYDERLRPEPPADPEVFLWRFMIDARYQGRGLGREALGLVVDHVRAGGGARVLGTSFVEGPGCPGPFYQRFGFRLTGEVDEDGEILLTLDLEQREPSEEVAP